MFSGPAQVSSDFVTRAECQELCDNYHLPPVICGSAKTKINVTEVRWKGVVDKRMEGCAEVSLSWRHFQCFVIHFPPSPPPLPCFPGVDLTGV